MKRAIHPRRIQDAPAACGEAMMKFGQRVTFQYYLFLIAVVPVLVASGFDICNLPDHYELLQLEGVICMFLSVQA